MNLTDDRQSQSGALSESVNLRKAFEDSIPIVLINSGTGLGLSIIRQIMELVDGNVRLDTSYAGGARFVVEWPQ